MQRLEVRFPQVDHVVEPVRGLLERHPRIVLHGAPGSGRSAVVLAIAADARSRGERVVLVAPPERSDDSAAIGLTELAVQLDPTGALHGRLREPSVPWAEKLDEVVSTLRSRADDTLVLVDLSPPTEPSFVRTVFARRTFELLDALRGVTARTIVTASPHEAAEGLEVELQPRTDVASILSAAEWGVLGDAAAALSPHVKALAASSALDVRLRVLLVSKGVNPRVAAGMALSPHEAVRRWMDRLSPSDSASVRAVIGRLALVRTPFDRDLLARSGFEGLSRELQVAVRVGLLFGDDAGLRLHETIARDALARAWLEDVAPAHRSIADWHEQRFVAAARERDAHAAARHEMEEIHHLTEAGDARAVLERSPWFVEQYDALGKALSRMHEYDDAIVAYDRALGHDPDDDYAHHYLAWNLDVLGRDAARVDASFRRAIDLRREHAWYHGRYICFLITRARVREAHAAWDAALASLFAAGPADSPLIYRELHGQVARLLLHRGRLDFAEAILADIPVPFREEPWVEALARLLVLLREAERDEVVFPPSIPLEERSHGPHLVPDHDREHVRRWIPGRVAAVDEREVHLRIAEVEGRFSWRDLSLDEYRALAGSRDTPGSGTYVELVTLDDGRERILVHRLARFQDIALPKLFPDPDRYIRRAS